MFQRVVENISRQLAFVLIRYIAVLGFQQGEGGVAHRYRNSRFHPLYRGTWYLTTNYGMAALYCTFPSAISRYLVSDRKGEDTSNISTGFHPLYRGTWYLTTLRLAASPLTVCSFHPLYRGTWYLTIALGIIYITGLILFPSAISRYLVSDPTRKTPPLTSGGGNGLHTPRRIDHIPTFASLNHDKNTRSTHYTPNAGIEFSQAGFAPPGINPVQNSI